MLETKEEEPSMQVLGADERETPAERRLTLSPDAEAWVEPAEPDMPSVEETPSERDTLVARYFGEVRQYALLSVAEEHALWAQIEHCKVRGRRALYMSPVALATLMQRGPQGAHAADQASAQQDTRRAPCAAALDALTTLHTALQALQTQRRAGSGAASERRAVRKASARHWHPG